MDTAQIITSESFKDSGPIQRLELAFELLNTNPTDDTMLESPQQIQRRSRLALLLEVPVLMILIPKSEMLLNST